MLCKKCRVTMLCEDEKELRCRLEWKRVVARNTKFTPICNKLTPLQLVFGGPQLKNLHFVLAKCLKWCRNHDPYSTKTTSSFICSKWKRGKHGNFQRWDGKEHDEDVQPRRASYRRRHHVCWFRTAINHRSTITKNHGIHLVIRTNLAVTTLHQVDFRGVAG